MRVVTATVDTKYFTARYAVICTDAASENSFVIAIGGLSDMDRLCAANNEYDKDQQYSYRVEPVEEIR